jgi:hypothetical protein
MNIDVLTCGSGYICRSHPKRHSLLRNRCFIAVDAADECYQAGSMAIEIDT